MIGHSGSDDTRPGTRVIAPSVLYTLYIDLMNINNNENNNNSLMIFTTDNLSRLYFSRTDEGRILRAYEMCYT